MDRNHIFDLGYDVVVAITQRSINEQLSLLADPDAGSINSNVIVSFEPQQVHGGGAPQPADYIPHFYTDWTSVPKVTNAQGQSVPQWATVNGQFQPSLTIGPNNPPDDDGRPQKVVLQMVWKSGTLYAADQVHSWDITNWTWTAAVDMQVSILTAANLSHGLAAPVAVLTKLKQLTAVGASSLSLSLDFVAGGEWNCRAGSNTDPAASVANQDAMIPYFYYLVNNPISNPYYFAYSIAGPGVPPSLNTIGCTFSLFQDTQTPDHSTVSFIFNTQTSPTGEGNPVAGINKYPGRFADNWIAATKQGDGKVIYSTRCFLAELIVQPIKQAFRGGGDLQRDPNVGYWLYSTRTVGPGEQTSEQALANLSGTDQLLLTGSREVDMEFGSDLMWSWSAASSLSGGLDTNDNPVLIVGPPTMSFTEGPPHSINPKGPPSSITGTAQNALALFNTSPPGTFAQEQIMLPIGDYFFAKDMGFQSDGTFSTTVTLKSPTGSSGKTVANGGLQPDMQVIENNIGKVIALKSENVDVRVAPPKTMRQYAVANVVESSKKVGEDQNALGMPMQDQVSLALLQPSTATEKVDITVSSELMKNSKIAMPMTAGSTMIAAQDTTGHPLLCSIGSDMSLNMLVANSGETDSGWTTTNLLQSFPDYSEAPMFDLVQEVDGRWSLAFVASRHNTSTVFIASSLSNDLNKTDLNQLASSTLAVDGVDPGFSAESIRLGNSQDGARPLLTVEGSLADQHILYQLGPSDAKAVLLELPQDVSTGAQNLLDHCTGVMYGYASNYFLYNVGQVQQLIAIARDSPSSGSPGSINWDFSPVIKGAACHSIATCPVPDTPRFSDLYVGGVAGVFRVPDGQVTLNEVVAHRNVVGEVTELTLAHDGSQVAVWTVNTKSELYYIRGVRTPGSKTITWGLPILFSKKIARVAPTRSFLRQTNELFLLDQDAVLSHYWQDPVSTLWRKRTGNEQAKATVVNYDSYTTHIHFEQDSIPVSKGMIVSVTSSEWQYITINNKVYSVDNNTPATVRADAMGNLTIIHDAVDTAPPVLHVTSTQFAEILNIYPNGKVHKLLANVTNGSSLNSAKDQGGKAVVPSGVDSETTDGVATRVQAVHNVGDQDYPPVAAGNTFLVVENPAAPSARGLKHTLMASIKLTKSTKAAAGNSKPLAAMTFADGKWRPMTEEEAQTFKSAVTSDSLDGIFDVFGDVWHAIENAADDLVSKIEDAVVYVADGISFVLQAADDGMELLLNYLGKALKFVLNTYLQVFKAISALLKLIGIDITAILRWLGHLMGWDTIWDTHKLIADTLRNFLHFGVASTEKYLDKARTGAKDAFADLEQRIKNLEPSSSTTLNLRSPSPPTPPAQKLTNSPQANFAFYHFQNALVGTGTVGKTSPLKLGGSGEAAQSADDFGNVFETIILRMVNDIIPKLGSDIGDLVDVLKSGSVVDAIKFVVDLLTTFLDGVEDAVDILLVTLGQIIGQLESVLDDDFGLPILAALYEFVTGLLGDGEEFSVINGFSFIAAMATVVTLDVYGEAQLPDRNSMDCRNADFPFRLEQAILGKTGLGTSTALTKTADPNGLKQDSPEPTEAGEDWSYISGIMLNISNVMSGIANAIPDADSTVAKSIFALSMACTVFGFPIPAGEGQPLDTWIQRIASWAASSSVGTLTSIPEGSSASVDALFKGRSKTSDEVKGAVSLVMGIMALALAIEIDVREGADVLTWMSDMCGNLGGIGMSVGQFSDQLEMKVASVGFTFFGAVFAFGECISTEQNKKVFKRVLGPW